MLKEAQSASRHVAMQLTQDRERYAELGRQLRAEPPGSILTVARGSSDHAANYCAYLIMARLGRIVASLPMSLVTLNNAPLIAKDALAIAISQSGQSPDVIEPIRYFRDARAATVALVNDVSSPLALSAEWAIPLHAGAELSVAATKSFIASLVASALLTGYWQNDIKFLAALDALPEALDIASHTDWSMALEVLVPSTNIMVVGRGVSFPVALESALKFKETSAIQAEAFSGAEIKHGPMALIGEGYPLLMFATRGPAQAGLLKLAEEMRGRGAKVLLAAPSDVADRDLTLPTAATPDLDPIVAILAFYVMAAQLSIARGMDPDRPRHLSKVTKTN
ncbi:glutamine--fructose-6-phosphate transaminase [Collimonas sp. OK307]|uniref:SIS domain-containing protein n=1 Tax=Collimonas sp. OK307 TaxID=1801620 RepID=UPI0008E780EF|nr:SIS domain-containing protein [Collimonas sp. OK307]SFH85995.1 glutamine--fructose-6-phosphate transaminase [Collimonas sp. OK307]